MTRPIQSLPAAFADKQKLVYKPSWQETHNPQHPGQAAHRQAATYIAILASLLQRARKGDDISFDISTSIQHNGLVLGYFRYWNHVRDSIPVDMSC